MSDGPEKKPEGPLVITMTTEEFGQVCRRVHKFLLDRADKNKNKRDTKPTKRSTENAVEAAKDVFAFVHLMEMVEEMTQEIYDLRQMVSAVDEDDEDEPGLSFSNILSKPKKHYMN